MVGVRVVMVRNEIRVRESSGCSLSVLCSGPDRSGV